MTKKKIKVKIPNHPREGTKREDLLYTDFRLVKQGVQRNGRNPHWYQVIFASRYQKHVRSAGGNVYVVDFIIDLTLDRTREATVVATAKPLLRSRMVNGLHEAYYPEKDFYFFREEISKGEWKVKSEQWKVWADEQIEKLIERQERLRMPKSLIKKFNELSIYENNTKN